MLLDERVENHSVIMDCSGLGLINLPYSMIKETITTIRSLYHCNLHSIFCLNTPVLFGTFTSYLMDESSNFKIDCVTKNISDRLL